MKIDRKREIRELLTLSPEEVISKAGSHLEVCENLDALHLHFAEAIAREIRENSKKQDSTRFILPVGPIGQYPLLANIINKEGISLKNCWFFFMDEYCDEDGKVLSENHPLSFKRIAKQNFLTLINKANNLIMEQVYFPNEKNIDDLTAKIQSLGGIQTCYGGIGIHGHVAFNEPAENVKETRPRKVALNNFTITINAIRAEVGGNLENFPRDSFTLGMREILGSKRLRLYCRNGTPCDWANTILRIALFGSPGDDYPVTHIRNHPDYIITTDKNTLECPKYII